MVIIKLIGRYTLHKTCGRLELRVQARDLVETLTTGCSRVMIRGHEGAMECFHQVKATGMYLLFRFATSMETSYHMRHAGVHV